MKKHFLFLLLSTFIFSGMNAQKFGYVNSSQLLLSMPEIKEADQILVGYQEELVTRGENMVKKFEGNYTAYLTRVNNGEMSQVEMQQAEAALSQEQQTIQAYEVEVQQLIAKRKQELYQPVLQKVQELVDQIGKENGYTMIFDASIGGILFATEGEDLMPLIKERLGI